MLKLKPLHALRLRMMAHVEAKRAFSNSDLSPVLIYQMGKVGSSTVYESLKATTFPNPVLHVHFLSGDVTRYKKSHIKAGVYPAPYHIYLGESVRRILARNPDTPCKIISLVRDPIAFVISGIFQNPYFFSETLVPESNAVDPEKVLNYLDRELRKPGTFDYVNEWFDKELKQVFGIDVFARPFPKEAGYGLYSGKNAEALVIRLEDLSRIGPKAIAGFLGLDTAINLKQRNARNDLHEAEAYLRVQQQLLLDPTLCREIYSSRFVKHYYSEAMIERFISKWSRIGGTGGR